MVMKEIGIILRGSVSDWLKDIIIEYQEIFPNAEIIVSTWKNQKTNNLPCRVVTS